MYAFVNSVPERERGCPEFCECLVSMTNLSRHFLQPRVPPRAACHGQRVTVAAMPANKTPRRTIFYRFLSPCSVSSPRHRFMWSLSVEWSEIYSYPLSFFSFLNCPCDMSLLLMAEATKWAEWQKIYIYFWSSEIYYYYYFFFLISSIFACQVLFSSFIKTTAFGATAVPAWEDLFSSNAN